MTKCVLRLYRSVPSGFFNIGRKTLRYIELLIAILFIRLISAGLCLIGLISAKRADFRGLFFVLVLLNRLLQGAGGHFCPAVEIRAYNRLCSAYRRAQMA